MIFPIRAGRTFRRLRTSLYSSRMSSVTSHVKSPWSAQLKSTSALGYLPGTCVPLNPEMPATNTFVSAVDFGGIEECDAAFHGRPDDRDHLLLFSGRTVAKAHSHAAQPDSRDFQIAFSKFALLHCSSSCAACRRHR